MDLVSRVSDRAVRAVRAVRHHRALHARRGAHPVNRLAGIARAHPSANLVAGRVHQVGHVHHFVGRARHRLVADHAGPVDRARHVGLARHVDLASPVDRACHVGLARLVALARHVDHPRPVDLTVETLINVVWCKLSEATAVMKNVVELSAMWLSSLYSERKLRIKYS